MSFSSTLTRSVGLAVAMVFGVVPALLVSTGSASAATIGVGDITDAMRYGSDDRVIGEIAEEIQSSDDDEQLIEAPWPMNFFGREYTGICVTSNGTVSPVVLDDSGDADCNNDYDEPLDYLAERAEAPVIAAFANDNDLGETVREAESTVATFRVAGDPSTNDSIVTITTDGAHGLTSGDVRSIYAIDPLFDNGNTEDTRTDEYWYDDVTVTVVNPNTFNFSGDTALVPDYDDITPTYPAAVKNAAVTVDYGVVWDDFSADIDGVDDGVGVVNTVYIGETTINGRDAWVYTNYRTVTNDGNNPDVLTNTFQIVLIKRATPNGATRGFDFDIEYNYGTVLDGDDGYDAPEGSCDEMNSECRTGVGLVDWDAIGEVADVYELFASTPGRDLADYRPTAMTSNRLNSEINGRYTFAMVGGAVNGFAVPVMDGSGDTESRPEPEDPLAPVPGDASLDVGASLLTSDGEPVEVVIQPTGNNQGLVATAGDLEFIFASQGSDGNYFDLDADGNLILSSDGLVETSGIGFAPSSRVKVYAFSEAIFMGMLVTDETGAFTGTLQIPPDLSPGVHNLQVAGYDAEGNVMILTIGVYVTADGSLLAATGFDSFAGFGGLSLVLMGLGIGAVVVSHRRSLATR